MSQKTQNMKGNNKFEFINIKIFCFSKDIVEKIKRQTENFK